jgi:hypothetical protein
MLGCDMPGGDSGFGIAREEWTPSVCARRSSPSAPLRTFYQREITPVMLPGGTVTAAKCCRLDDGARRGHRHEPP